MFSVVCNVFCPKKGYIVMILSVFVDGSGNEWKTRYETQVELNGQLERQISDIHERLEDMKGNPVGEFTVKTFLLCCSLEFPTQVFHRCS